MPGLLSKLRSAIQNFGAARTGNVAITFALATLPLIGGVGAAIDYSHANSVKVALQAALDSTALMLSKEATSDTSSALQADALKYFKALFTRPEGTNIAITANYTTSGGSAVVVNGQVDVPTVFMGIMGFNKITVSGSSTVKWGSQRLRVALVLDNTGSMADAGKITALQSATQNLLTQLKAAAVTNGDVYVSIIPFVKDVNVGTTNYNSNWIYWGTLLQDPTLSDNNSWDANNGSCSGGGGWGGGGWGGGGWGGGGWGGGGWGGGGWGGGGWGGGGSNSSTRSGCLSSGGLWTPANHNTWNGCVMDRGFKNAPDTTNNYDTNVGSPSVLVTSSLYPAEQYSPCPQAAMGLSYDWTGMSSLVNNMSPGGNTNQAIGLQLGWMSLAGGGPFTSPPKDPNYTYKEIIILLTDGLNTQDRWYSDQSSIDTRQEMTCNNIKSAGITLYTIQVNTGGDPTSTLLQNCASDSNKFWMLTSASGIAAVFSQIGTNLTQLRVAK